MLLLTCLFESRYTHGRHLYVVLAGYAVAKLFEAADATIYALGQVISGHTVKHFLSALATYWVLHILRNRQPDANVAVSPPAPAGDPAE